MSALMHKNVILSMLFPAAGVQLPVRDDDFRRR